MTGKLTNKNTSHASSESFLRDVRLDRQRASSFASCPPPSLEKLICGCVEADLQLFCLKGSFAQWFIGEEAIDVEAPRSFGQL